MIIIIIIYYEYCYLKLQTENPCRFGLCVCFIRRMVRKLTKLQYQFLTFSRHLVDL